MFVMYIFLYKYINIYNTFVALCLVWFSVSICCKCGVRAINNSTLIRLYRYGFMIMMMMMIYVCVCVCMCVHWLLLLLWWCGGGGEDVCDDV